MKASWTYAAIVAAAATAVASNSSDCYCLPGDSCWPSVRSWNALNTTVGGRLVATVPIGTPCHDPHYDEAACNELRETWHLPQTHYTSSSSVMQTYFANQSCDPFTPEQKPCTLGNYVSYAVNVSSSHDVVAAIKFAQANHIRFVIRNTGHDYLGRSTGAGALSVWTHHLNDIHHLNWTDANYHGPALKVGAGVMGFQVLKAASDKGLVIVTGECPTVGLAGGYTQGGGHSALSTSFGLAADQTLSFEVVTASGRIVTASRSENQDLYWALSGGGAGNYGVVISMTIQAHPDTTVSGASLQIYAANTTSARFTQALTSFHTLLPNITAAGATAIYQLSPSALLLSPLTAYNKTKSDVQAILSPFLSSLDSLHIPYKVGFTQYPGYYAHYNKYMGPLPYGNLEVSAYNYGGRLIPRDILTSPRAASKFTHTLHNLTSQGLAAVGVALDVSSPQSKPGVTTSNAVTPAFRNAGITMQFAIPWNDTAPFSDMIAAQMKMTHDIMPALEAVTPGSGTYENEADFRQPDWQETFFGSTYERLREVKRRWDPAGFFYVLKGVGSEMWNVDERKGGRMCRVRG